MRTDRVRALLNVLLAFLMVGATPAFGGVGGATGPTWPATLLVGAPVSAYIDIVNASNGPNASEQVDVLSITFLPSCRAATVGQCTTPDLNVFALGAIAVGSPASSCKNVVFTLSGPNASGQYTLIPNKPVHLGPADGSGGTADPRQCRIVLNGTVTRLPNDSTPASPPATTIQFARAVLRGHSSQLMGAASGQSTVAIVPAPQVDLLVTKSDGLSNVTAGATVVYTVVVANNGPNAADGAVLRDPAMPGLIKVGTPTCGSALGGAVCPTTTLTNANLEAAGGVVIPALPAGGSLTFLIYATVQATP